MSRQNEDGNQTFYFFVFYFGRGGQTERGAAHCADLKPNRLFQAHLRPIKTLKGACTAGGGLIITDLACLTHDPKIANIGRQYVFSVMQHEVGAPLTQLGTKSTLMHTLARPSRPPAGRSTHGQEAVVARL